MKVAVVGPTGVLGRALVPMLLDRGYEVRTLSRSNEKARSLFPIGVDLVEYDLLAEKAEELPALLAGCDVVMHIATAIPSDFTAPNAWVANSRLRTEGVRTLLNASIKAGTRRYIQQSITMAYPDHGDEWITETAALDQSGERPQVCTPVIAMEQMIRDTPPDRLGWSILRGSSFVGKGTFQETLLESLRRGKEVVPCDGNYYISLVHVMDVASAFALAVENAPAGSIFNITDDPIRYGDYLDKLADSIGVPRARRDHSANCPPSWRCSNQAAKDKLNWQPTNGIFP